MIRLNYRIAQSAEAQDGNSFYVACMDCGSRSVNIDYKEEAKREDAAQRAADLWNTGKVISSHPGE